MMKPSLLNQYDIPLVKVRIKTIPGNIAYFYDFSNLKYSVILFMSRNQSYTT